MGMALRHALALLLVLLPLAVTTAYTIKQKDGGFGWDYCSSDNLTHSILEWGPKSDDDGMDVLFSYAHGPHNFIALDKSDDDGMDVLFSYAHVPHNFIALDMSVCHAGSCDTSENRRGLAYRRRYISYEALKKNRVPCNRRGKSYYNCKRGRQANPYRRGCSFITRCARIW
ncbi:protein RALF-like 19 [Carex littledalei]|uniref:Protein RALF-like 19 n=1 Tax=Carex littledalei TaxID=544730 RepID=A0A833QPX2_9POAL|nr:protein RALF-like 19 [Carex littledalei]